MIQKPRALIIFFFLISFLSLDSIGAHDQSRFTEFMFSQLIQKLSPISATVVQIGGDALILDRGGIHGVEKGDLFQIYSKGEPFKYPGEQTIGYLKKPISIVQVTKTNEEKAWAKVISGKGPFFTGMPAARFSDMKAIIVKNSAKWFASGDADKIIRALSALTWNLPVEVKQGELGKDIFASFNAEIIIMAGQDSLKVYAPGPSLIFKHEIKPTTMIMPDNKTSSPVQEGVAPFFLETFEKKIIGNLTEPAVQVLLADLDDKDGEKIIYLLPSGIFISPFKQSGKTASYKFTGSARPVSFSLCPEGRWIAVNLILDGVGMRSVLLRYENGNIKEVQNNINLWLYFKKTGKARGGYELLGQSFDNASNFGVRIFKLNATENGLEYKNAISLPDGATIANSISFDMNENQTPELVVLDFPSKISIFEDDKLIWSSKKEEFESAISNAHDMNSILAFRDVRKNCLLFVKKGMEDNVSRLCWLGDRYEVFKVSAASDGRINGLFMVDDKLFFSVVSASETILYRLQETQ